MLWGAFGAKLIDHKLPAAAIYLGVCAVFSLFGVIHSVDPAGSLYWPWTSGSELSWHIAIGYAAFAVLLVALDRVAEQGREPPP